MKQRLLWIGHLSIDRYGNSRCWECGKEGMVEDLSPSLFSQWETWRKALPARRVSKLFGGEGADDEDQRGFNDGIK